MGDLFTFVLTAIGTISSLIGIYYFVKWGIEEINKQIKKINEQIRKSNEQRESQRPITEINFYILFSYSLIAAALGGLVWIVLNGILGSSPYLGGTSGEPHGIAAIIWPIATNTPIVITLVILGWKYHFAQIRHQLLLYVAFLFGVTLGSIIFYNLSLYGVNGFRNYFDSRNVPFKELWLVLIWSSLLSVLGFLSMGFTKSGTRDFRTLLKRTELLVKQTGLCIGLTTLPVVCFLLFYSNPRFDTARGVIAGVVLRMTLFFGLFLGTNTDTLNPFTFFGITRPRGPQNASGVGLADVGDTLPLVPPLPPCETPPFQEPAPVGGTLKPQQSIEQPSQSSASSKDPSEPPVNKIRTRKKPQESPPEQEQSTITVTETVNDQPPRKGRRRPKKTTNPPAVETEILPMILVEAKGTPEQAAEMEPSDSPKPKQTKRGGERKPKRDPVGDMSNSSSSPT